MNDVIEYMVKRKMPKSAPLIKLGLGLLSVFVAFLVLMTLDAVMLLVLVALIITTIIIVRNMDIEYEYTLVNNELQVDKIISKRNRRAANTFNFGRLEAMAPVGHSELSRFLNKNYKVLDYSSNNEGAKVYSAYVMCENEMVNLLFEPNDKMLAAIKYNNRNVFID